jgi:ABC-2 type transport system ATP-binding protein
MNKNIIETEELVKRYGAFEAVRGLNFSIRKGEIFGFLGPNGAGKTTTISMLATLLKPTGGSASVAGYDVVKQANQVKRCIGLVPQELAFYPTLSAYDNLIYFGSIYGMHGKELRMRVDQVLEMVALKDRAREAADHYSGGMKRRLNIAAGLLHSPQVLFLDEPTVGVDPQSRNAIFEYVKAMRDEGMTVLYTTHYMEEAEQLCDRVAIVDGGRIVALDTPQNLIAELGQSIIHLGLPDRSMDGQILGQLQSLAQVKNASRFDGRISVEAVHTQKALVQLLQLFNQTGVTVSGLEVLEPNLETVFLQLTGKKLRE